MDANEEKKEKFRLIVRCLDRFEGLWGALPDRLSAAMDIEFSKVDVKKLLDFEDVDFIHDMCGIFRHMDRGNKCLADGFVPRAGLEA